MSKEHNDNNPDIDNEWGIDDLKELGGGPDSDSINDKLGQTTAFGGQMPIKDVTADLTNVISSQIIVDAVKNNVSGEEYVEDYVVEGELNTEPEPYIPIAEPRVKAKPHKVQESQVDSEDYDSEDEEVEKGDDKLFLIGSLVIFMLVIVLGVFLIVKLHGNNSNNNPPTGNSNTHVEGNLGGSDSQLTISTNQGELSKPSEVQPTPEPTPSETAKSACEKDGHKFKEATCVDPKICEVCGKTEGNALGHDFELASCDTPTTCKRCGQTGTDALGHKYKDATCIAPKTCERCGATTGEALGHKFEDATCQKPKTCSVCGVTEGVKLEHQFVEESSSLTNQGKTTTYKCTVCGETKSETVMTDEQRIAIVISLVNAERTKAGLSELTTTQELSNAAGTRSREIASVFDHTRPNGSSPASALDENGVSYSAWGENIAAGQLTPEEVVQSWMSSQGHRDNIMNPSFNHIGVGYNNSGTGYKYYWVQLFTN